MIHKIVSFVHKNLTPEIAKLQKEVFDKLDIDLIQYEFDGTHGNAIKTFLDNEEWDLITLFDVDCIPLNSDVIKKITDIVDDNTIYGNAQISNSTPYAAPNFLSFTKNLYINSPHKYFEGMYHTNELGETYEADCSEVFVKENVKIGKKMLLSLPVSSMIPLWKYNGDDIYEPFEYGTGTKFDNETFHCFQIRFPEIQSFFINYVNDFLNEN